MNRILSLGKLAEIVDDAAFTATEIPQLTEGQPLTVDDAYGVQALSLARRYARGERRVGMKMGLTSRAKMAQVGVDEMVWGRLTDAMQVEEGGVIRMSRFVHPRAEPEVAYLLKAPLTGKVTAAQALAAVEAVAPAIEIIDSRYRNFKFALPDVVADNSSSSAFVVGQWAKPDIDVGNLGLAVSVDGQVAQVGSTAAILGHPMRSLVAAARLAAQWGERLEPGWIVLAGGITAAHHLAAGMAVRLDMQKLGSVSFQVVE